MEAAVKMRLGWVQHYQKSGNASLTSRRCGISRPTLQNGSADISSRELQD